MLERSLRGLQLSAAKSAIPHRWQDHDAHAPSSAAAQGSHLSYPPRQVHDTLSGAAQQFSANVDAFSDASEHTSTPHLAGGVLNAIHDSMAEHLNQMKVLRQTASQRSPLGGG